MGKNYKGQIKILDRYIKCYTTFLVNNPPESKLLSEILDQLLDLAKSIKALLKEKHDWQCLMLNRTIGELAIFIFVSTSLKKKSKKAFFAIYELHGWLEVLEVFDDKVIKEPQHQETINEKIKYLENIIFEEFGEPNEEINHEKIKKFVRQKLNKNIYEDAKKLAEQKYKSMPIVIEKISKNHNQYQIESNFTHGRYISTFFKLVKDEIPIANDTTQRLNLAFISYAINEKKDLSQLENLLRQTIND